MTKKGSMASEHMEPTESLASIDPGSPSSARRNVAAVFQRTADADAALFVKCGIGDDGRYYTSTEAVGADVIRESIDRDTDRVPTEHPGWEPQNPPTKAIGTFRTTRVDASSETSKSRGWELLGHSGPAEQIRHEASVLLYDESRFLGWLAVLRAADRPFDSKEVEELNLLVDAAVDILSRAENRERELLDGRSAIFLLHPESLEVACSTKTGSEWLDDDRERDLKASVDSLRGGEACPTEFDVDGFRVRLNELSGSIGERLVARVEYPQKPELSIESILTPRQREVVEYAAAGATNREIAKTLGISPDTVSDHLSESYRRLGVANRVELARKVAESG